MSAIADFLGMPYLCESSTQYFGSMSAYKYEGDMLVIKMEVPGCTRQDVQVTAEGGKIRVTAERKDTPKGATCVFLENRTPHSVNRAFRINRDYDPESAKATVADGVLTIHVQKASGSGSKTIKIE